LRERTVLRCATLPVLLKTAFLRQSAHKKSYVADTSALLPRRKPSLYVLNIPPRNTKMHCAGQIQSF